MIRVAKRQILLRGHQTGILQTLRCLSDTTQTSSSTEVPDIDYARILGPREIYDSAYSRDKVLSVPYERILEAMRMDHQLADHSSPRDLSGHNLSSDDLLIISKIMRRVPRTLDDEETRSRQNLARQLCYSSALMGNVAATLFWAEETLRSPSTTQAERDQAMKMLTMLAGKQVGKANHLIANELYSLKKEAAAMKAYRLAGEQGVAEAYTKLGRILRFKGHLKQSQEAFRLAAEAGEPNAQFMMSRLVKDATEKTQYLLKAASGGKEEAAHNLGEQYRAQGQTALAKEYYEMAAQKGLQPSQVNLATILAEEKQFDEAEKWFSQAMKAGGEIGDHASKALHDMKDSQAYKSQPTGYCTIM